MSRFPILVRAALAAVALTAAACGNGNDEPDARIPPVDTGPDSPVADGGAADAHPIDSLANNG